MSKKISFEKESSQESIFSSSDLHDIWEDITSTVGYLDPYVVATTKSVQGGNDVSSPISKQKKYTDEQLRYKKKIQENRMLQKQVQQAEAMVKEEKQKRTVLEDKLNHIREYAERDRIEMENRIREETHTGFHRKMQRIDQVYKNELEHLRKSVQTANLESTSKDDIVNKLVGLICYQDMIMTNFQIKIKKDIHNNFSLSDFYQPSFEKPSSNPIIIPVPKKRLTLIQKENKMLKLHVSQLESELTIMKGECESIIEKWKKCLLKINSLERENKSAIESYEAKINVLERDYVLKIRKFEKEIEMLKSDSNTYKKHTSYEFNLNKLISQRQDDYQEILKKELTMA
ncbi:unnamed protein product [Moneuplotes crassus]|uniref:Uncharacterized protein n=1 Tax=Euplotes crassus TaxID=5936 RepID=A0AAD1UCI6_EUPCR|nr:unnamed protein product [Moneuplotes crassus]